MTAVRYTVNEHFPTFQGEGLNMGVRAYFIRLQGCDVGCTFCDSASTWHAEHKPADLFQGNAKAVADLVKWPPQDSRISTRGLLVVITGGEPALHDLAPLVTELHERGYRIAIETAGHREIRGRDLIDHICLSPKPAWKMPLTQNVVLAKEFKIIVERPADIVSGLAALIGRRDRVPVWLHPEWSHREDPVVLAAIRAAVMGDPTNTLRAGWQLHKLYGVDEASGQTRALVPLGGRKANPEPRRVTPPREIPVPDDLVAFTIGYGPSYDIALSAQPPSMKCGKTDRYEGGWVWRTAKEAAAFIEGNSWRDANAPLYGVYELRLRIGWDVDVSREPAEDGVHRLLNDASIVCRVDA